jgi:ribosomal-protein-alanine N-acetyltransferase
MLIDSPDVMLRQATAADVDEEFCGWYRNDDGHLAYFSGSGRTFDRETLVADIEEGFRLGRWFYYLVTARDGTRIGTIKVGPIDQRNQTSDLVSLIGNRAYVGKGLGAQAVAAASRIAFASLGVRRLHSGMYANNVSSIRAYVRAGWFIEATMRGFYLVEGAPVDRVCVACLNPAACVGTGVSA